MIFLTQLNLSLQMSPPPSSFNEPRSGGGSGGPLSHFYSGSPTSYFTSGLQAGLKQSHLNKVSLPYKGLVFRTIGTLGCLSVSAALSSKGSRPQLMLQWGGWS